MSVNESNPSNRAAQASSSGVGKRGCLLLMLGGLGFIVAVFAVIIYVYTRPKTPEVVANERGAIERCLERARDPATSASERSYQTESCQEMIKQFTRKYGHAPDVQP